MPAPDGITPTPAFLTPAAPGGAGPLPAPLRLPVAGVRADGIVDLGADGLAVICRASAVTFSLRTPAEQEALVAGFARFLNSLGEPVEILVRAEPVDLTPAIDALLDAAPGPAPPGPGGRGTRGTPGSWPTWPTVGTCCAGRCWSCSASRIPAGDDRRRAPAPSGQRSRRRPRPPPA